MRKARDDSTWSRLTPEQREILESWLFDENLGYVKTLKQVQTEFGCQGTIASLGRYYRRRARERQVSELASAQVAADELNELPVNVASLREAAIKLVGKAVLKLASEKPQELEALAAFTKLLLASEDNEIRRGRLQLARQYFDYEAKAASLKELPHWRSYLCQVARDTALNHEEKMKRVQAILFGWDEVNSAEGAAHKFNHGNGK